MPPPKGAKCVNHPTRDATYSCKRCSAALCDPCRKVVAEGNFCSEACVKEFREFQAKIWADAGPKRRITITGLIRYFFIVSILLAVIYAALYFWLGTMDFSEMAENLRRQYRAVF